MPLFGASDSPAQTHVAAVYLKESVTDIGVPNVVTAILASYRGFDTLGEVVVVFTACVGVLMLIGGFATRRHKYDVEKDRGPRS